MIKKKNREGFIDRQRKELWEGEEENHLLFPGKANYHWLNGDYPVTIMSNDSSLSRHASRSVCHRLDALTATLTIVIGIKKITSIESAADL